MKSSIYKNPNKITLENPQDLHTHLRGHLTEPDHIANNILQQVVSFQKHFSRILAMPNILPDHLKNIDDIFKYQEILENAMSDEEKFTEIIYTISLKPETTVETLKKLKGKIGLVKYFPGGVTTNSGESSGDIDIKNPQTYDVLKYMEDEGIPLSLHPETTHAQDKYGHTIKGFVHDAEREFVKITKEIAQEFPNLKIIIEHISTKENAQLIDSKKYKNVYATVTPQHLLLTAHDKEGGHGLNPHMHCKSNLKSPEDLIAIQKLVLSGNKNIYFGSDSAPHPVDDKESDNGSAGAFSSPIAIELITDWFFDSKTIEFAIDNGFIEKDGYEESMKQKLEDFLCNNGNKLFGKPKQNKIITLENKPFIIPNYYGDNPKIVPILSGKELNYSVISVITDTNKGAIELIK